MCQWQDVSWEEWYSLIWALYEVGIISINVNLLLWLIMAVPWRYVRLWQYKSMCFAPFKVYWWLDAPRDLISKNCTFCPHCIQVFVFILEQTAIFSYIT